MNLAPNPFLHANYPFPSPAKPPIKGLWPLCFHGLTNCFSRKSLPLINICVAPRVCGSAHHSQFSFSKCICGNTSILNGLPPLGFSCLSFSRSVSLFSATCGLFLQNTGGWVPPSTSQDSAVHIPGSRSPNRLCRRRPSGRANITPQC